MKLTVILQPEADGGYSLVVPALPGVATQGDSLQEAFDNAREAVILSLEVRKDLGLPGPIESLEIIAREVENCLRDRAEEGLPLTIETRELDVSAGVAA